MRGTSWRHFDIAGIERADLEAMMRIPIARLGQGRQGPSFSPSVSTWQKPRLAKPDPPVEDLVEKPSTGFRMSDREGYGRAERAG